MTKERVYTDFDGTVTDTKLEATPFIEAYYQEMSRKTGINVYELRERVAIKEKLILDNPQSYGWEVPYGDHQVISASATAGPYILCQIAARLYLSDLVNQDKSPIRSPSEAKELLRYLFQYSYPFTGTAFREGAKEYLEELSTAYELLVITSSNATKASAKLARLGLDNDVAVIGDVKKHYLDPSFDLVPEKTTLAGLARPVYLRRREYFNALSHQGSNIAGVIGDIYELDLSLPEHLGIQTFLVAVDAPEHEKRHYLGHNNGYATNTLAEVIPRLAETSKHN
ncbi:MAG: hypothetical protein KJ847_02815 [Firmicutes bacterium]|nr:hypothetical protein [Bacillota bacterium]